MARARTAGLIAAAGVLVLALWPVARSAMQPGPPEPTDAMRAHAASVRILRDGFGVPHVFGHTDADTAFGLAYAHAEDDWPTIQGVLAASRGRLGLLKPGKTSLLNDGYAALVDVEGDVAAGWETIDPHVREVLDAYADGLNLYAHDHPDEVDARLLPYTGQDVVRGFVHKLPLMLGLPEAIAAIGAGTMPAGPRPGSNAHAVAPWRSTDGITRLNVNSHQPWEGPVTWYEAHVHSDEGWDAVGGTFPGAPVILHGHNDHVGWALTVNHPDTIDAYALVTDPDKPGLYRFDDAWWPLDEQRAWLPLDTPWLTLWVPHTIQRSKHGPIVDSPTGPVALRWSSRERGVRAVEEWFRMNKATSSAELVDALRMVAIPMFNVVYADAEHVGYVYNAALPVRDPAYEWRGLLPGDTSATLWTELQPLEALPQVHDPWAGFVSACNSTPWRSTLGADAPQAEDFPEANGIEALVTNRTLRTLEILRDGAPVSRDGFLAMKWDRAYSLQSPIQRRLVAPLADWEPDDPDQRAARDLLLAWDGRMEPDSTAASIALLAWRPLDDDGYDVIGAFDPQKAIAWTVAWLRQEHGRIDVPLSELQRLRHGDTNLPLAGGPDVLGCTYHHIRGDELVGDQGDSYVMIVEFGPDGVRSDAIHQYGASLREDSPHHSDQAPLFVTQQLRPVLRTEAQIRAFLEAEYHPGDAWTPRPPTDPEALLREAIAASKEP